MSIRNANVLASLIQTRDETAPIRDASVWSIERRSSVILLLYSVTVRRHEPSSPAFLLFSSSPLSTRGDS